MKIIKTIIIAFYLLFVAPAALVLVVSLGYGVVQETIKSINKPS